jgi:hypothetical protein
VLDGHADYPRREWVKASVEGETVAVLRFQVRHRYEIPLPEELAVRRWVKLRLVAVDENHPLPSDVHFQYARRGRGFRGLPTAKFRPQKRGTYRIAAFARVEGKFCCIAAADLVVVKNPVDVATARFRLNARLAGLAWAGVATVAGMIWIGVRTPTFGSLTDYLVAFAWALGLSTVAVPAEGAVAQIMKALGIGPSTTKPAPPVAGGKDGGDPKNDEGEGEDKQDQDNGGSEEGEGEEEGEQD